MTNIYKETFKNGGIKVEKHYLPKINGYKVDSAYILENGSEQHDDETKTYVVMKIYVEEG